MRKPRSRKATFKPYCVKIYPMNSSLVAVVMQQHIIWNIPQCSFKILPICHAYLPPVDTKDVLQLTPK